MLFGIYAETETWLTFGFQYGNYWEKVDKPEGTAVSWIGSPGIVLNGYAFWNKNNIGLFIQDSFLFPNKSKVTTNGITITDGIKDFDSRFLFQFGIGPGFKYNISDKFKLYFGLGPNISMMTCSVDKTVYNPLTYLNLRLQIKTRAISIGIIGDTGVKYDISNIFYVAGGLKIGLDFAGHLKIETNIPGVSQSKWNSGYLGFHLNPYLGIGFNVPF